jgi:hypothetical protein
MVAWCSVSSACAPTPEETGAGDSGDSSEATGTSESTGNTMPDAGGSDSPDLPAPPCDEVELLGEPADVALTPRADRDAESLALRVSAGAFVARQDHYEVIVADLAAIREIEPELAAVRIECEVPVGYDFWFNGPEVVEAVWRGTYRAWDCHNAFYGIEHRPAGEGGDVWRIDGIAFAMQVDGLYSQQFVEVYRSIPGMEEAGISPKWTVDSYSPEECEASSGSIDLQVTDPTGGGLGERTYTFMHPSIGVVVYAVAPGEAPVRLR